MAAAGVVALELVVNLCRGVQFLLQTVGPYQGSGTVHLVKVLNLLGNRDVAIVVIQLLFYQFPAEDRLQLLGGHGLMCGGVQQGSRLLFHVCPHIVPGGGHFALRQIDFVGYFLFAHIRCSSFLWFRMFGHPSAENRVLLISIELLYRQQTGLAREQEKKIAQRRGNVYNGCEV